jgi:diguanylate cyclase (GGDEF)-like protein
VGLSDDERLGRESLALVLRDAGHEVEVFDGAPRLLERAAEAKFDIVLLDVMMPRMSGLEACRLLKGTTQAAGLFVPVVLLSGRGDVRARTEGLRMGADDFLAKPYDPQELLARIGALLRIKRQYDEVAAQRDRLVRLSVHDELLELYSGRYLRVRLAEEFHRAERYHDPLALLLVDIDALSAHNDAFGRAAGDAVLHGVAQLVKKSVRDVDVVGRTGGDDLGVILPSTHFAGAATAAERIARAVGAQPIGWEGRRLAASVSVGVGLYPSRDVRSKDGLLRAAESALRHAKREGPGRVCVFQQQGFLYVPGTTPSPPPPRPGRGP